MVWERFTHEIVITTNFPYFCGSLVTETQPHLLITFFRFQTQLHCVNRFNVCRQFKFSLQRGLFLLRRKRKLAPQWLWVSPSGLCRVEHDRFEPRSALQEFALKEMY